MATDDPVERVQWPIGKKIVAIVAEKQRTKKGKFKKICDPMAAGQTRAVYYCCHTGRSVFSISCH